jgi:hypothetical protein
MWLMLADTGDDAAVWAAEGLRHRGVRPLRVVSGQELAASTLWDHRLDEGGVRTRLRFQDGLEVDDTQLRAVVNRLSGFSVPPAGVSPVDSEYAACERSALLLSWLVSLRCPVLNRPSPASGPGGYRSLGAWRHLAQRAGLRILPLVQSDVSDVTGNGTGDGREGDADGQRTVFVVAGRLVAGGDGDWDEATEQGCARLSQLSGQGMLAMQFTCLPQRDPLFCSATQQGDLRWGGSPLLDLLADELA